MTTCPLTSARRASTARWRGPPRDAGSPSRSAVIGPSSRMSSVAARARSSPVRLAPLHRAHSTGWSPSPTTGSSGVARTRAATWTAGSRWVACRGGQPSLPRRGRHRRRGARTAGSWRSSGRTPRAVAAPPGWAGARRGARRRRVARAGRGDRARARRRRAGRRASRVGALRVARRGRRRRGRLGQVHRWFLFRMLDETTEPTPDGREFRAWRWVEPEWLIDQVVPFRRPGYAARARPMRDATTCSAPPPRSGCAARRRWPPGCGPRTIDDVVGQPQLLGPGRPLRRLVEQDRLSSVLLWGPPGTGKTTLALAVAGTTARAFEQLSAVTAGVKDVREVIERARQRLGERDQGTILFLDEIHRFSKAQQDALLPAVEDGTLVLIGATTENPFFEVNPPLRSRSTLFRLEPLEPARPAGPRRVGGSRRSGTTAAAGRRRPARRAQRRRRPAGPHVARGRRRPGPSRTDRARPRRGGAGHERRALRARRPLRRDQRVHQVDARLGPRCRRVLAGPHARGGRGRRASSPGGSSSSPARTSAWPTRRRSSWPPPPPTPSSSSVSRRPSSTCRRR